MDYFTMPLDQHVFYPGNFGFYPLMLGIIAANLAIVGYNVLGMYLIGTKLQMKQPTRGEYIGAWVVLSVGFTWLLSL